MQVHQKFHVWMILRIAVSSASWKLKGNQKLTSTYPIICVWMHVCLCAINELSSNSHSDPFEGFFCVFFSFFIFITKIKSSFFVGSEKKEKKIWRKEKKRKGKIWSLRKKLFCWLINEHFSFGLTTLKKTALVCLKCRWSLTKCQKSLMNYWKRMIWGFML